MYIYDIYVSLFGHLIGWKFTQLGYPEFWRKAWDSKDLSSQPHHQSFSANPVRIDEFSSQIFRWLDLSLLRRSLQNPPTFYMVEFLVLFLKKMAKKHSSKRRIVKMFLLAMDFWEGWTFAKSKSLSRMGILGIVNEEP